MNIVSSIIVALLTLASLLQGIVAFLDLKKKTGHPKIWFVSTSICLVLVIISGIVSYASSPNVNSSSPAPNTPTTSAHPPSSPTTTSGTTATPAISSSATVANGVIVKNLILTCSQCASDPVHVTIHSIQVDNATGRMIWDTALRDITGSGLGFSLDKYDLQASGSMTPVHAVLPQVQFSGNQADVQAIFAFPPSPNVTYTLTIVVNWAYNTAYNIYFDPIKITF